MVETVVRIRANNIKLSITATIRCSTVLKDPIIYVSQTIAFFGVEELERNLNFNFFATVHSQKIARNHGFFYCGVTLEAQN